MMKWLLQVTAEIVGGLAVALIVLVARDIWTTAKFVRQLQSNHLPHIYYTLGLICKKLGIDFEGDYKL